MVKKMCAVIILSFIFSLALSHVKSSSDEAEKKLDGKWRGTLCTGMPVEGKIMMMKYMCDDIDMQFDQTEDHVIGSGLFSQTMPLYLKGVTHDNFFYGTNAGEDLTTVTGSQFIVARGFLYGNTMQMMVDVYEIQNKVNIWLFGGITTLYKQEKK